MAFKLYTLGLYGGNGKIHIFYHCVIWGKFNILPCVNYNVLYTNLHQKYVLYCIFNTLTWHFRPLRRSMFVWSPKGIDQHCSFQCKEWFLCYNKLSGNIDTGFTLKVLIFTWLILSVVFLIIKVVNETPLCILDKINTHSIQGYSKHIKVYIIKSYEKECTLRSCYVCGRRW